MSMFCYQSEPPRYGGGGLEGPARPDSETVLVHADIRAVAAVGDAGIERMNIGEVDAEFFKLIGRAAGQMGFDDGGEEGVGKADIGIDGRVAVRNSAPQG